MTQNTHLLLLEHAVSSCQVKGAACTYAACLLDFAASECLFGSSPGVLVGYQNTSCMAHLNAITSGIVTHLINGCMHCCRSILPENLHFDKDLNIKLTHFASALDLGAGHVPQGPEAFSVVDYLAPEVNKHVTASTQLMHVIFCLRTSARLKQRHTLVPD